MQESAILSTKTLQKMIDTLEETLMEPVTPSDIAEKMCMSVSAMNQLFRLACGITVMEYVRNRRLTLAAQELLHTRAKIIDLALKYGYETPEAFTKAFTRFHGFPPSFVRRIYPKCREFLPMQIQIKLAGGFLPVADTSDLSDLPKETPQEQEKRNSFCYDKETKAEGGIPMKNSNIRYHITTAEMLHKEDWQRVKDIAKKLQEANISYKVDGKTMIFAHGLEFPLEKICLTFLWKEEARIRRFFGETQETKSTFPGFKYFDTTFQGKKVRCMFYSDGREDDSEEFLLQNAEPVEVDELTIMVQTLDFYRENAEPKDAYYQMVDEFLTNSAR